MSNALKATHEGTIDLGVPVSCAVLDNGTRVVYGRKFVLSLGFSEKVGGKRLPQILGGKILKSYINKACQGGTKGGVNIEQKVVFLTLAGQTAHGYNAKIIPIICKALRMAHREGCLREQQKPMLEKAEVIADALLDIGINALIDESTGYDELAKGEYQKTMNRYLCSSPTKQRKLFENEFYEEIYRLKGWGRPPSNGQKPSCVGTWTVQLVYDRLPGGITDELKKRVDGHSLKWHQFLSEAVGRPHVKDQLIKVTATMRTFADGQWDAFKMFYEEKYPEQSKSEMFVDERTDEIFYVNQLCFNFEMC